MDTWAATHLGWGGRGGGEDAGPPAAGLEPAPPYTRFPPSLGLVWTTDSVAGRVSKESEGQVRSWGLDRTKTLGGLPALGPTHEKSSRRVPGRGSRRLGGPAGFEASPISPKLTGARWPRVGPSICWACPSRLHQNDAKTPHLRIKLCRCSENPRAPVSDLDPAPHFLGLQVFHKRLNPKVLVFLM